MNAPAVIERLQQLGVSVEVDGAEVFVDPAERVPDELWPELSRRKLDIFAFLMTERIISETPNPNALIDRLRIGHRWVSASAQFLADDPTHGAGTSRLPETMRWTRVWVQLDKHLRQTSGYKGCILEGQRCRDVGGLLCRGCQHA
jgi:hypothetical protein